MTEALAMDETDIKNLDDKLWRRLGITQTFEQLMVKSVAIKPGPLVDVRDYAGESLQGGALKFWEMSFPQLLRDLSKRQILTRTEDSVSLSEDFSDRLQKLLGGLKAGDSHVAPTPGVTLEDVLAQAKAREERLKEAEKEKKKAARKTATKKAAAAKPKKGSATPKKRSAESPAAEPAPAAAPAPAPTPATPARELFTSRRVNSLLNALDTGNMTPDQLTSRLSLSKGDMQRFLDTTTALGLTRLQENMVELHWDGRELARTSDIDRRMAVRDTVNKLREHAEDQ